LVAQREESVERIQHLGAGAACKAIAFEEDYRLNVRLSRCEGCYAAGGIGPDNEYVYFG
jgi:hypothetical protein